jgi:hypothetical protein
VQTREGVTPPFMEGRRITRVGLLLPFSLRPQDAASLYNAATRTRCSFPAMQAPMKLPPAPRPARWCAMAPTSS